MLWVLLFVAIAAAGLAMTVAYGVWLAHKSSDVMSEVAVLGDLLGKLGDLAGQIRMPPAPEGRERAGDGIVIDGTRYVPVADVG